MVCCVNVPYSGTVANITYMAASWSSFQQFAIYLNGTYILTVPNVQEKREKVVTLRMNEESFQTVEGYAESKGLTVSAYINSIIDQYVGFSIPLASVE